VLFATLLCGSTAIDFKFKTFDNKSHKLSEYKTPIVLNWWAVWCPYCISELSTINSLYPDYSDKITIISLAVDFDGNPKNFVEKHKYPWIFGYSSEAHSIYNISAIPVTIFINKNGEIINRYEGELSKQQLKQYLDNLIKNS